MISHTLSKTEFQQFQAAFKARANANQISSVDMVVYNLVRGKPTSSGFTAVTNSIKLNAGQDPWYSYKQAKFSATYYFQGPKKSENFKGQYKVEMTEEQFAAYLAILKGQ